jgi:C-terminal processing protease CtpA/Prc
MRSRHNTTTFSTRPAAISTIVSVIALLFLCAACNSQRSPYQEAFDLAWQTVNDHFYDATFGGVDWDAMYERYQPRVDAAVDDSTFYHILNEMLFELNVSHSGAGPRSGFQTEASPYMFAPGAPGFDVRLLDSLWVVTEVRLNGPAHEAGIRTGDIVRRIDGRSVTEIASTARLRPPNNPRSIRFHQTEEVLRHLYGPAKTEVTISCTDSSGTTRDFQLERAGRNSEYSLFNSTLWVFTECRARIVTDDIGQVYFNSFLPPDPETILNGIAKVRHKRGLILDLRGNNGGRTEALLRIGAELVTSPTSCCKDQGRETTEEITLEPSEHAYSGLIAILIDGMSISAAEILTACLQASGRAVVIGEQTPGMVLGGATVTLPNDGLLVYPYFQVVMNDGSILENQGVVPDIRVSLERDLLSRGVDSQLDAAIRYLTDAIKRSSKSQ